MSIIIYSDPTEWKKLPLKRVLFYYDTNNRYTFDYLKDGSNFTLRAIVSQQSTNTGGNRTVAYKIEARIVIIQTNFGDMTEFLNKIQSNAEPEQITFYFDPIQRIDTNDYLNIIWRKGGSYGSIGNCSMQYSIELTDGGPELIINLSAVISVDALNETNFVQYIFQAW